MSGRRKQTSRRTPTVCCNTCGREGPEGVRMPFGWFFAETRVRGEEGEPFPDPMIAVRLLACSELCKSNFWHSPAMTFKSLPDILLDYLGRRGVRLERAEGGGSIDENGVQLWRLRMGVVGTLGTFEQCVRLAMDSILSLEMEEDPPLKLRKRT